ncbi:MAG: TonB-dependent receptor family protein [Sphingopyxis sp.]
MPPGAAVPDGADGGDGAAIIVTAPTAAQDAQNRADQVPGGADVVPYADYADRFPVSLRDALALSPGVYLQPRYGQEVRISIRGSGLSRGYHMRGLTLLQDGVSINLADDNGDFQELEPIFFDHLEVVRGANALRYGSGTLGGAVNGVTPTGRTAQGGYVRVDAGAFNTVRGLAALGTADGDVDAWAAISADRSDGDRNHAQRRSLRFHGNMGFAITPTVRNRIYASINVIEQQLPGALTLSAALNAPRTGNYTGNQARNIKSMRLQDRATIDTGLGEWTMGAFLNAKSLFHPIFQVVDQESVDRGGFFRFDGADQGLWSVTVGGEWRTGDVASRRYVNNAGRRGALTFSADQDARTANLYGELRLRPVTGVTLVGGAIYADGYRAQHEAYNASAGGVRNVAARADFHQLSPKFGLLVQAAPAVQLFGNFSRSAEMPGLIELAQISQFVPLRAQRAWTAELGTRGTLGALKWDVTAYRADVRDEILQFTISADVPASTFNAGRTRHQGVEASIDVALAPWLRVRQTYSYSDFRFRGDAQYGNNRLPVVPQHVLRADARFGDDALHIAPNVEWVPRGAFADYRNTVRVGGYASLGFTAGMRAMDGVDLFVDARNLAGTRAVGDISAVIAATAASAIYIPVERRAGFAGVRARL